MKDADLYTLYYKYLPPEDKIIMRGFIFLSSLTQSP